MGKGYELAERGSNNISTGGANPNKRVKYDDPLKERDIQLNHLSAAFRTFARQGYIEGSAGHISIRDPVDLQTFWINPLGVHFAMIKKSHLVQVNAKGEILNGGNPINTAGFMIHLAIYTRHPTIRAISHAHSINGKAYSALGRPLDMITQDVLTFYNSHGVYTNFGGVALDEKEGIEIAETIVSGLKSNSEQNDNLGVTQSEDNNGNSTTEASDLNTNIHANGHSNFNPNLKNTKGVILQNHGLLTVGTTVDESAYLFCLMERSCQANLLALATGLPLKIVGHDEAEYTEFQQGDPDTLYTEYQPEYQLEEHLDNSFLS